MRNYVLSPSILAADFKVLGQEMKEDRKKMGQRIFILTLWMECLYQVYHLVCRFWHQSMMQRSNSWMHI